MPIFVLRTLTNIVIKIKKTVFKFIQSDLEHVKKACRHVWVIPLKELALHGKGI